MHKYIANTHGKYCFHLMDLTKAGSTQHLKCQKGIFSPNRGFVVGIRFFIHKDVSFCFRSNDSEVMLRKKTGLLLEKFQALRVRMENKKGYP